MRVERDDETAARGTPHQESHGSVMSIKQILRVGSLTKCLTVIGSGRAGSIRIGADR